jgi:hypothetical protein
MGDVRNNAVSNINTRLANQLTSPNQTVSSLFALNFIVPKGLSRLKEYLFAKNDACGRSFAVLWTQVSTVGLRLS